MSSNHERSAAIARLNDQLRKTGRGGQILITQGVSRLHCFDPKELAAALAACNGFETGNDPYGEHDFCTFEVFGAKLMWKIDYYDRNLEFGSEDPADPHVTVRVLTVMLASEY